MTQQWLQAPHNRGKEPRQRGPQRALCWEHLLLSLLRTPEQVVDTCEWLVSRYCPPFPRQKERSKLNSLVNKGGSQKESGMRDFIFITN